MSLRLDRSLLGVLAIAGLGGCSGIAVESGESVHYLIVGFGVVSVPRAPAQTKVSVSRMNAIGFSLTDQPGLRLGLGYSSGTVVAVPADTENVLVEVTQRPFGELRIETDGSALRGASASR